MKFLLPFFATILLSLFLCSENCNSQVSISNETSSKRIFQNDEVVENNGVYFYRFDMTPINGVINGLIISGGYVNGKIECRNGKFHGEVLTFFDNGIDTLEIKYFDEGRPVGIHRRLHQNGVLASITSYRNYKLHGEQKAWWSDGTLEQKKEFSEGIPIGVSLKWNYHAVLIEKIEYQNGLIKKSEIFYNNGQREKTSQYIDGQLIDLFIYFKNGQIQSESHYSNEKLIGIQSEWLETGQLVKECHYLNGILTSPCQEWSSKGKRIPPEYNELENTQSDDRLINLNKDLKRLNTSLNRISDSPLDSYFWEKEQGIALADSIQYNEERYTKLLGYLNSYNIDSLDISIFKKLSQMVFLEHPKKHKLVQKWLDVKQNKKLKNGDYIISTNDSLLLFYELPDDPSPEPQLYKLYKLEEKELFYKNYSEPVGVILDDKELKLFRKLIKKGLLSSMSTAVMELELKRLTGLDNKYFELKKSLKKLENQLSKLEYTRDSMIEESEEKIKLLRIAMRNEIKTNNVTYIPSKTTIHLKENKVYLRENMEPLNGIIKDGKYEYGLYVDGIKEGTHREWYSNGQLKSEINYKGGSKYGLSRVFFKSGEFKSVVYYYYGRPISCEVWDELRNKCEDKNEYAVEYYFPKPRKEEDTSEQNEESKPITDGNNQSVEEVIDEVDRLIAFKYYENIEEEPPPAVTPPAPPPFISTCSCFLEQIIENIVDFPDVEAGFPGGAAAMMKWFNDNIKYPQTSIEMNEQGRVFLSFVVETNGSISNVKIERGISIDLDREAKRVIKKMPKWVPGESAGRAVRARCRLPINFQLQ